MKEFDSLFKNIRFELPEIQFQLPALHCDNSNKITELKELRREGQKCIDAHACLLKRYQSNPIKYKELEADIRLLKNEAEKLISQFNQLNKELCTG